MTNQSATTKEALELPERIAARICRCGVIALGTNACPHCGAGWTQVKVPLTTFSRVSAPIVAPVVDEIIDREIAHASGLSNRGRFEEAFNVLVNALRSFGSHGTVRPAPASTVAPQQSDDEIRFALEGMIAAFDGDGYGPPSIVATTRECALSVAKQAVGWAAPASPAAPTRSVQHLVNQWQAAWLSTQDISRDSEADLVRRIESFAATPPSTLAKAAAEEIFDDVNFDRDPEEAKHQIATIIERCLSAEGEDQKNPGEL